MTTLIFLVALTALSQVNARVLDLNCSDNATCINSMARELVRSVRQQKTVRLFNLFTLEPLEEREKERIQARGSMDPLTRMMKSYAISFDWNDFTFRFSNPDDEKQTLDLELFESRSTKDVSEDLPKKSNSKVEEEVIEVDARKPKGHIKRRRQKRKVLQAVFPMLFGMKSAGAAIFGLAVVTVLTLKAFFASKMALGVTVYLAMKKFYESYGTGVGLQNHPYLYSQYPIDFPSATSNAYSVSGVSPQFASPEMYSPTALAANTHTHEMLQHSDASAQQSQQASILVNATRASERWDGKSKLLRLLEPMFEKIRSVIDPIATVFYDAMPATFRGLNSDVSTAKNAESTISVEEGSKKPREILVPQPRNIAQRKMFRKATRQRPKKYSELKVDLNRLKQNKDLPEYVKTKKYKYNYPQTFYYPRVKYFVNPSYIVKPNNSRLMPYRKISTNENSYQAGSVYNIQNVSTEWKPIVVLHPILDFDNETVPTSDFSSIRRKRTRRSLSNVKDKKKKKKVTGGNKIENKIHDKNEHNIFDSMFIEPLSALVKEAEDYAKGAIKHSLKSKKPPVYYTFAYSLLMQCIDAIDGLIEVHKDVHEYLFHDEKHKRKTKRKIPKEDNDSKPQPKRNVTATVSLK